MQEELAALRGQLQALSDKQAIQELIHAIAKGVDRYDPALLAACIDPAAVIDMGGDTVMTGSAFAAGLKPPAQPRPGRMHVVGNVVVTLTGDTASSESYIVSCMDVLKDEAAHTRVRAGRYLDRFARGPAGWRLVGRTMVDEWGRVDPVKEAAPQGRHRGRPAPDDLSYTDLS